MIKDPNILRVGDRLVYTYDDRSLTTGTVRRRNNEGFIVIEWDDGTDDSTVDPLDEQHFWDDCTLTHPIIKEQPIKPTPKGITKRNILTLIEMARKCEEHKLGMSDEEIYDTWKQQIV